MDWNVDQGGGMREKRKTKKMRKEGEELAILAECPRCHKKQSIRNRVCECGEDLFKAKRASRLRYWITYRLGGGKQRKEYVGESLGVARDAMAKRAVQKRENKILDVLAERKMSFRGLSEWYLGLERTKNLKWFPTIKTLLAKFLDDFGERIVSSVRPSELEEWQQRRKAQGLSDQSIDLELAVVKAMLRRGVHNGLVSNETLSNVAKVPKLLKPGANVRQRVLSPEELRRLLDHLPPHTKAIVQTAVLTGMRRGELLSLRWPQVDLKNRLIRLEAAHTKTGVPRIIPICETLYQLLERIPRAIHDDHVFLFNGKPIQDLRTALETGCKRAGLLYGRKVPGGFVFHDLRHLFVTLMRKAGNPSHTIMTVSGHRSDSMFRRYDLVDVQDIRLAVDRMENLLGSSVAESEAQVGKRG